MKIIFLDIDGVLCFSHRPVNGYFRFNKKCVQNLKRILKKTNADIVLSSTRRDLPTLRENYKKELGVKTRERYHYGETPRIYLANRELEILYRLGKERGIWGYTVENRIAIDDDIEDMQGIDRIGRLVKCDPMTGLTEELAEKAIEMLNG